VAGVIAHIDKMVFDSIDSSIVSEYGVNAICPKVDDAVTLVAVPGAFARAGGPVCKHL
jgi:hypothetical protein